MAQIDFNLAIKKLLGKMTRIGEADYVVYKERHHSAIVIGAVGGLPANANVDFFNDPDDQGTVVISLSGEARTSLKDGKPNDGEIWAVNKVWFTTKAIDGVTDVTLFDQIARHALVFQVIIGDNSYFGKAKPLGDYLVNRMDGVAASGFVLDFSETPIKFGSGQSIKIRAMNKGAALIPTDATPTAHDTALTAWFEADIYRPKQAN
jgi:hypothetical protein